MAFRFSFFLLLFLCVLYTTEAGPEPEATSNTKSCSCSETSCTIQYSSSPILYHQVMTPLWIKTHASYIDPTNTATSKFLTFDKDTAVANAVLVKVPILLEGQVTDVTPLSVELKVSLNTQIGTVKDSDITFLLCDDQEWCYGIGTVDKHNYVNHAPCYVIEGKIVNNILINTVVGTSKYDSSQYPYPGEFNIQFKLQERWVSCFAPVGGGFFRSNEAPRQLRQSKGLNLVVTKSDKGEEVGISMIKVTVMKEN